MFFLFSLPLVSGFACLLEMNALPFLNTFLFPLGKDLLSRSRSRYVTAFVRRPRCFGAAPLGGAEGVSWGELCLVFGRWFGVFF